MRRRLPRAAKKKPHPKTKLGPPDLDQAKAAVLGSLHSPESQRGYQHSINEFLNWYCSEPRLSFNKTVVTPVPNPPRESFLSPRNDQRPTSRAYSELLDTGISRGRA
jgi:hypothetical protein